MDGFEIQNSETLGQGWVWIVGGGKYEIDENQWKFFKSENLEEPKMNSVRLKSKTRNLGNEIWHIRDHI